jgi:uncharacterized Zn-binding protein involved in type VI secretion
MAQIVPVVSEALEAQIRDLLPSQRGFGEDLQASNVITPIIDLTSVAQGTSVPQYQQQALAFGSQTAFNTVNTTDTIISTAGFYRIFGVSSVRTGSTGNSTNTFSMSDGLATKVIWGHKQINPTSEQLTTLQFDFIVFLRSGDNVTTTSPTANCSLIGSTRQVANVNGNPVNPVGFTPQ